ncbi:MAG: hypothetical protein KDC34_17010 [Saprospiraceae bacterium]|nr:hypothetical protein [Saprospiraceae bacterium]
MKERRTCRCCEKDLRGRADQKFCSAHCRSNYHNKENRKRLNLVREVNRELLKNRKILKQFWLAEIRELNPAQLEKIGYRTDRITGLQAGQIYCCYDFGIRVLNKELLQIVHFPEGQVILREAD